MTPELLGVCFLKKKMKMAFESFKKTGINNLNVGNYEIC
jgi:hypothetical protein